MPADFQEYLTANEQVAYPFREDSDGLAPEGVAATHGATATVPSDFIIDAVIVTPSTYYGRVFLSEIINAGGGTFQFYLFSEERRTVAAFLLPAVPANPRTLVTMRDTATGVSVRLLTGPSFASYLAGTVLDDFASRLPFETAAVEFRPTRVEKFIVENPVPEEVTGEVVLLPGYNMTITPFASVISGGTGLDATNIELSADPGAGLGRYNECDDPPAPIDYIARINGVAPDEDGQVFLCPAPCHRLGLQPTINTIILYNDCTPCCDCEDYANTVEALDRLFGRLREIKLSLDDTIELFNEHVTIYNRDLWTKYRSVLITGNGHSGLGDTVEKMESLDTLKSGNYATLVFHITNRGCQPITDVRLQGDITVPAFNGAPPPKISGSYAIVQRLVNNQTPPGLTQAGIDEDSILGPVVDMSVTSVMQAGEDLTVYFLLKRPFPLLAAGCIEAKVEYVVGTETIVTDTVLISWD